MLCTYKPGIVHKYTISTYVEHTHIYIRCMETHMQSEDACFGQKMHAAPRQKMHAAPRLCLACVFRRCMQHRVYDMHASSEQAWRWAGTWPRNCCRSRSSRSQMGTCAFCLAAPAAAIKGGLSPYRRAFCGESTHSRAVEAPVFAPAGTSCRPSTHTSVCRVPFPHFIRFCFCKNN